MKKKLMFIFQIILFFILLINLFMLLVNYGKKDEYIIGKWVLIEINTDGKQLGEEDIGQYILLYDFKTKNKVEIEYENMKFVSKYTLQSIVNSSEKEIFIEKTPHVRYLLLEKQIKIIYEIEEGTKNILTLEKQTIKKDSEENRE
ncbi:MAG: hypothetical protein LBT51_09895 [Fusobacteriaceae bacterium]|nr:hypothetical protein [Fusobacteriaceae bacterium]